MAERRRIALAAGLLMLSGSLVGAWLLLGDREQPRRAEVADYELMTVARRTLSIRSTHDGELGFGDPVTMPVRATGTLTWLPQTGTVIERGQPLLRVDDEPVFLMYGETPAFRDLYDTTAGATPRDDSSRGSRRGDSVPPPTPPLTGSDVWQLEVNLTALNYTGFTVDHEFTPGTAAALKELQRAHGAAATGRLRFGQALFQPGPIRVVTNRGALGHPVTPDVVRKTGREQLVTVTGASSELSWATAGSRARVQLPDQRSVAARVVDVSPHEGRSADGGGQLRVRLRLLRPPGAGSSGPVTVSHVQRRARDVLVVPVTALLALAEGGYGVQLADGTFATVVPGLFADGFVEVSGDLPEGARVRVPT